MKVFFFKSVCITWALTLVTAFAAFGDVKPLRVGLTGKYPPFNFFDEKGVLTGFDVETANALCRSMQRKCVFKILPLDGLLSAVLANKIDVVIGSIAITEERSKKVLFSNPYYESGGQLFVKNTGADPKSPNFKMGVTLGTTYGDFAAKAFPQASIRSYKGETEAVLDFKSGRLDGMITDRLVGSYINQVTGAGLVMEGPLLFEERIGIPIRKTNTRLYTQINQALSKFLNSEEHTAIRTKYFGAEEGHLIDSVQKSDPWALRVKLMLKAWISTIAISVEGLAFGTVLSFLFAYGLIFTPKPVRVTTRVVVDFVRSTPFMIQLFAIYFGLPPLGVTLSAWTAAIIAIGLHLSAYLSETIKIAYQSVPLGQHQAARVLGLSQFEAFRYVIFPQMLPLLTVPTLNLLVAMVKDSAVVSVISIHELTMQTQQLISATFRPIEFYAIAAGLYALITYPLLALGRRLEIRYKRKGLLHG